MLTVFVIRIYMYNATNIRTNITINIS